MLDKPKVLVVLNSLHAGGAQKVTITLFNHLSQNYDVHYLVLDETEPDLQKKIHRKASVTFLPKHRQRIRYRFFYMARFIRELKPNVIFSTMNKTNQAVLIAKKMSFKKVPVIVREANYLSLKYPDMGFIRKGLLKYLYNRVADKVMIISEEIGDDLHENYGIKKEKMYLINNPIDLSRIQRKKQSDVEVFNKERFNLLAVGRLVEQKNYLHLVKTMVKVKASIPKAHLTLLGAGPLKKELKKEIQRLDLAQNVTLKGHVSNPYPYYDQADVFILSSLWEGFPNALLEAMATQTCVLSYDCPSGPKEILKKDLRVLLLPLGDSNKLLERLNQVCEDNSFKETMARKCFEEVKSYDIHRIIQDFKTLLQNTMEA